MSLNGNNLVGIIKKFLLFNTEFVRLLFRNNILLATFELIKLLKQGRVKQRNK